jgi:hypothetical protein
VIAAAALRRRFQGGVMEPTGEDGTEPARVEELRRRIAELQGEHRALDEAIVQFVQSGLRDDLHLQRMKKRKLLLKDSITRLEMGLIPDIPA